jgi:iron complex transport system ATP-binding protein
VIRVEKVGLRHKGAAKPVLSDIDFRVEAGEIAMLLGPNGSGKTTLLKCVSGLWRPSSGQILLDGRDVSELTARERALRVAVVPQKFFTPFGFSVESLVLMARAPHIGSFGSPSAGDRARAREAMASVGVAALADRGVTHISGGEQQLALLARALVQESPILLLDEPTSHLDLANQLTVMNRVKQAARERRLTVLSSLHDPNIALAFADRVVLLKAGRVVRDGPPETEINEATIADVYGVDVDVVGVGTRRFLAPRALRQEPRPPA